MEFKKVYSSLLDLFPQVDPRALKAVAIEHSKDAGAAFLAVHQEIIPFFNEKRINSFPESESGERSFVSAIANSREKDSPMVDLAIPLDDADADADAADFDMLKLKLKLDKLHSRLRIPSELDMLKLKLDKLESGLRIPSELDMLKLAQSSNVDSGKRIPLDDEMHKRLYSGKRIPLDGADIEMHKLLKLKLDRKLALGKRIPWDDADSHVHDLLKLKLDKLTARISGDPQSSSETVSGYKCPIKVSSNDQTSQLDRSASDETIPIQDKEKEDVSEESSEDSSEDEGSHSESSEDSEDESNSGSHSESFEDSEDESNSESSEDDSSEDDSESHSESSFADDNDLVDESDSLIIDNVTVQPSETMQESNLDNSNEENMRNIVATEEDESNFNATMSQSSQIHDIDEIIADARSNKKTLFSSMETVIDLIRQVDLKEKAAEQAKFEAERGGMDTLFKVNELKQMLKYAKKGNDMDAGDVYGEKAILATELRELQSRVFSLSDERDESLAVLDEMRQTLEVQLAAIEIEIKSAEQEKLEKESAARKLLADQELVMEKVVQESKKLKQLTAENARLQGFLTDRGRTVDELQGEIAVICQDVMLLKEKFDLNLPLNESFFPSLTSFGLASSISSVKSLVPDQVQAALPVGDDDLIETPKNRDHVDEVTEDDRKALEDEGWELF